MNPEKSAETPAKTSAGDANNVPKIRALLSARDDTQRFVGLALLKSVLDNSPELRNDENAVQDLWASISPKFLDRLLRTGSNPSNENSKELLILVISILHTFSILLLSKASSDVSFTGRIPGLVAAAVYTPKETTEDLLQTLSALVNSKQGAEIFLNVEDFSPLTELCSSHPAALDVFSYAWLNAMVDTPDKKALSETFDKTMQKLVVSFTGTDGVTLLEFVGSFFRQADPAIIPSNPKWLKTLVTHIQNLVVSRPTPEARSAYTQSAASLLQTYPEAASPMLFKDAKDAEKPFGFLFVNLLLIDVRSSIPVLLEKLNQPEYKTVSRRLAAAFDTVCIFIGYLVRSLEDESLESLVMSPENLLKIRKSISETMSVTIEYIRDRWDAARSGAMGLHRDARASKTETSAGSHNTITWDSVDDIAEEDPFILSATRALSIWLREDENDQLRKEATGLTDVLMELYSASLTAKLDFRSPALVALEALVTFEKGRAILLMHDGWNFLSRDLVLSLQRHGEMTSNTEASTIIDTVRVLLPLAEEEKTGTQEPWMDFITAIAAWSLPVEKPSALANESHVAVLQLCTTVLAQANVGMRARYKHSMHAIAGIAGQVNRQTGLESGLREQMDDVLDTLNRLA